MTHAIALTGQWEGLRAFPRGFRTPDHRRRIQTALERLERLRDEMQARADALTAGARRADGLAAGMIDQLDAIDGDPDLEPSLGDGSAGGDDRELDRSDLEPSLCGITCNPNYVGTGDHEAEHDGREPDSCDEPSLASLDRHGSNQCGSRWIGGVTSAEAEDQCDDEGADGGQS